MENNKNIKIVINERAVIVSKLPLKKYADLLAAIQELPKNLDLINGKPQAEVIANLPALISKCYPDIVKIVMTATDLQEDEIDNMGLSELVDVVVAIWEVNDYSAIYSKLKNVTARPKAEVKELS